MTVSRQRRFSREAKRESRVFCSCELCRLRFGRMLYNRFRSGEPIRTYKVSSAYRRMPAS